MAKNRSLKFFKKLHKWPAIIISFIAILFAASGIIMNHRGTFSAVDVSRKLLPDSYSYQNWNLAGVRGSLALNETEDLMYGNIGIWKTNDDFQSFEDFNQGFPQGIDNRKIYSVAQHKNKLFAGTHLGLYKRGAEGFWIKMQLPVREERIADLALKDDTLLVLTRHYLLKSANGDQFDVVQLPEPIGYKRKTGLFDTFWQLHSGELWGLPGKLVVDLLGLVTILLSVTGLLHFFLPKIIRRKKKKAKEREALNLAKVEAVSTQNPSSKLNPVASTVQFKKKNLKWHNVVGYVFVLFLLINTFSGMHLRPPLLIPIANKQVGIIPGTHLDNPNPWFDKLRRVQWDENLKRYIFSTSEGFFFADERLSSKLLPATSQPPVSVMGCNVLEQIDGNIYLVGSFSGMFLWNVNTGQVGDFFTQNPHVSPEGMARPIAENTVAGWVSGKNAAYWFDFNRGAQLATGTLKDASPDFPEMPAEILDASPMSLWNVSLEIHTGRIFENILGPLYILYVPLAGICILLVLVSGFMVWWKIHRKKKRKAGSLRQKPIAQDPS